MGSIISGIFGGGSSPGQDAQMGALRASREDIQRYRTEAMQARLNALNNMTSAFQGANNALETLWGAPPEAPVGHLEALRQKPRRMLGHDLPQDIPNQPQGLPQNPNPPQDGGFNPLGPFGFFGGKR